MGRHLRSRPRALLDCDGVLSDFTSRVVQLINQELGSSFTSTDVTEWDFASALGLDEKTKGRIKRKVGDTSGFAASLRPYPGAVQAVEKIKEIADLYIVTSPWNSNPTWTYEREAWLLDNFRIKASNVVHGSAKYICAGDVFVDDKLEAVVKWQDHHPDGVAIKWNTLHNSNEAWSGTSTSDWEVLLKIIRKFTPEF